MSRSADMIHRKDFMQGMLAGLTGTLVGGASLVYVLARANLVQLSDSAISRPTEWLEWARWLRQFLAHHLEPR